MESAFLELMPLTCMLSPRSAVGRYQGDPTYGPTISPKCHVQYTTQLTTSAEGETKPQAGIVYLDGVYPVDTTWKLQLPIPGGNQTVVIIQVDQNTDESGFHHTAVRFGAY